MSVEERLSRMHKIEKRKIIKMLAIVASPYILSIVILVACKFLDCFLLELFGYLLNTTYLLFGGHWIAKIYKGIYKEEWC